MPKTFSRLRLAFCAVCVLCLFGVQAYAQERGSAKDQASAHPNGVVQDWSHRHVVYPRFGEIHSLIAVQNDPRAIQSWQQAEREDWHRWRESGHPHHAHNALHRDWNIDLGADMAPSMYPAKFGFDPNAAVTVANCTTDFAVFTVNAAGSAIQPNIVGLDQLYSGPVTASGICNRPLSGSDTGVAAEVMWSYNITGASGLVATSPALSLDGTKVAFVETGTPAHFHVLAWKSGDGVDPTNLQNVKIPAPIPTIPNPFVTTAPVVSSGTATDLAFGSDNDTLSSPFVDYARDVAYVGNDTGTLFRFKDVFCPQGSCLAPSLDTNWNGTGSVNVCSGTLTGAVEGGSEGNVFVGCSDGNVYGFTSAGVALTNPSLTVGNGPPTGGVVDPPMIDAVNNLLYAVSGNSAGGTEVVVQSGALNATFNVSPVTATLGAGGSFNMHAPSFNSLYFSSGLSADWLLYAWGLNAGGTQIDLWGITFSAGHAMTPNTPPNQTAIGSAVELSPTTEFLNAGIDSLFVGSVNNPLSPNFLEATITTTTFPVSFPSNASEGFGTTGIVVDNSSGSAQASSIYFGALTGGANPNQHSAVKLTQTGLN